MSELQPLPVWVKTTGDIYINLARMDSLSMDEPDKRGNVSIIATNSQADFVLASCEDEVQAAAALDLLVSHLPIAVVDMDLDVIAPLEKLEQQG